MAAFSTTVQKIGINGIYTGTLTYSTATTAATFTCGDLNNVVVWAWNNTGADNITLAISSTQTATRYAGKGIGSLTLTTGLNSSYFAIFGNFESARFKSTSNTFVITATTTIVIGAAEMSSTRANA